MYLLMRRISSVLPLPLQLVFSVCTGHTGGDLYVLCRQKTSTVTVKEVHFGYLPHQKVHDAKARQLVGCKAKAKARAGATATEKSSAKVRV